MKGDGDAAIRWLKTIPTQYLPTEIETDPAFATLKGRADFHRALFRALIRGVVRQAIPHPVERALIASAPFGR